MKLYPINLDVRGKKCVVVGGGEVALRKIRSLVEAGALVTVVAPDICAGVEELVDCGKIFWRRENFSPEILSDEIILIAATDNPAVNRHAAEVAQAKKILANVVNSDGGNFFVPSQIQRGELLLTISTGGNSPAFAKFLRQMLEAEFDENFCAGLELISRYRREIKRRLPNSTARKIFWQQILTQDTWQLLKSGQLKTLEERIDHALKNFGSQSHDGTR